MNDDWREEINGWCWYNRRLQCAVWKYDPKDDPFTSSDGPVIWSVNSFEHIPFETAEEAMRAAEELYGHRN